MRKWRVVAWSGVALLAGAGIAWLAWPAPVRVEVAEAARGPLRVTVEGPGKVRVRDRFVVAAPVAGHLGRPTLRAGDEVREGEVVATIYPATPSPLDERTREELAARLSAARAGEAEARAALDRAGHAAVLAGKERERARALAVAGSITQRDLDAAEAAADESAHAVDMATAALRRAEREARATAALLAAPRGHGSAGLRVRSPAGGRVLRVVQESEGPVAAGAPIVEVGDPASVELRVDLLTTDAVRVGPGAPVELVGWGGDGALPGVVRLVEPSGFTKVSALGVEEQRVYVVVDPAAPGAWGRLSDGYAADGRIVVARREDALRVPAGALFREGGGWAVFAVEDGRARLRRVRVGDAADGALEVVEGLAPGAVVVVHPGDAVSDGARVRPVR